MRGEGGRTDEDGGGGGGAGGAGSSPTALLGVASLLRATVFLPEA